MSVFAYSIIIPHRDSINLLKRAIYSIPPRKDIEIIVVDNSLTDCDFSNVLCPNRNIHIYYSDISGGAGLARNVGLQHVHGEWVLFLDADDFFENAAFDIFDNYNVYQNKSDIIFFKCSSKYSDSLEPANRTIFYNEYINLYLRNRTHKNELNLRYLLDVPWGKMISMNIIREFNIKFDECAACNDAFFSVKIGYYAKLVSACNNVVYCATVQKGSITNVRSVENLESRLLANLRIYEFLCKNKIKVTRPILKYVIQASRKCPQLLFKCFFYLIKYSYNPIPEIRKYIEKDYFKKKKIKIEDKYIVDK